MLQSLSDARIYVCLRMSGDTSTVLVCASEQQPTVSHRALESRSPTIDTAIHPRSPYRVMIDTMDV